MNRSVRLDVVSVVVAVLFLSFARGTLHAQSFIYTNNNATSNSVSAFSVAANGALTPVPGSPFLTGGAAIAGFFASNRITVGTVGNYLYVANNTSNNVSAFSINPATGVLTSVPGSPFATGGSGINGISLAATPDGKYLIAANSTSNNASVYSIAANGALTAIPGSPFALGLSPDGIKITPNGKFLIVASPVVAPGLVGVYSISPAGTLSAVAGSPFPDGGTGAAAGVDVECSSSFAFVGEANGTGTIVDVFNIAASGSLTPIPGSPFVPGVGINSNVPLLSPDDKKLFVSNQNSNSVTVFNVAANGSLSLVAGSPFPVGATGPSIMGTTADGKFLYTANFASNNISAFSIAASGALTPVPGSPFSVGVPTGLPQALTVFPPKTCVISVNIDIKPGSTPNSINRKSKGNVPVALLSSATFNAADADRATVTFAGAPALNIGFGLEDVNGDGLLDVVFHFDTQSLNLPDGTTSACLTGQTIGGKSFKGCDSVRLVQ